MKKYDIFISYRREGGFESANLIAEKLRGMGYSVFFDLESLRSGKFNEQLYKVIEQCKDFIVVLPKMALDRCTNENGDTNEEDWLRKEVLEAIKYQKNIIPIMLTGFEWPKTMPKGMYTLKDYQAITATSHDTFDYAMQRLASYCISKPHKLKLPMAMACVIAGLITMATIGYFSLLQISKPICKSVANEYTIGMGLIHELLGTEEELKTEWEAFVSSYNSAATPIRKDYLISDMISSIQKKEMKAESIRGHIRPSIELSEWQTFLLGLYGSQKEDVEGMSLCVDSYVCDLDTIASTMRQVLERRTFKPYEIQSVRYSLELYERSVNMIFYAYLQEITLLPEESRKSHNEMIKSWILLPTISMSMSQEEYERLTNIEINKMEELNHKIQKMMAAQENEMYDMEVRLDSLEAKADALIETMK
ncbi:MAG: toll/interleukin-1 receptor domain-containing protein [Bacteroidales bacterium]|nr:toll/interleukin-1 receptor domain-containing protein [Candidatus Liminaster caballi]